MNMSTYLGALTGAIEQLRDTALEQQLEAAAAAIASAGHIWCTGVGKSARAASLLAEDLSTLTLPASFIHGGDLLHGGMGRINNRHCLVLFSASGETSELVHASRAVRGTARILVTASATPAIEAERLIRHPPQSQAAYPLPGATLVQVVLGRLLALSAAEQAQIAPTNMAWAHPA